MSTADLHGQPVPTCVAESCNAPLVKRAHPTAMAASQGEWFDHPLRDGVPSAVGFPGVGHTASALIPYEVAS